MRGDIGSSEKSKRDSCPWLQLQMLPAASVVTARILFRWLPAMKRYSSDEGSTTATPSPTVSNIVPRDVRVMVFTGTAAMRPPIRRKRSRTGS